MDNVVKNIDKENVVKSKIPVPLAPLPPLPKTVLDLITKTKNKIERHPLETLNKIPPNAENTGVQNKRVKRSKKIVDTRYVTLRNDNCEVNWNCIVFNDSVEEKGQNVLQNPETVCLGESSNSHTPVKSPLESQRIRNIKKSLKRPHSRELQGISPIAKIKRGDTEESYKRKLDFTDRGKYIVLPTDPLENAYDTYLNQHYGENLMQHLLEKECVTSPPKIDSHRRSCIINWLVRVNGPDGNLTVVQTAARYFDTVLSAGEASVDKLQVIGSACYWIARKVHGPHLSARRLVRTASNAFSTELLRNTEKAVLKILKFCVHQIVPQDFIGFLSWICDTTNYEEIEKAATVVNTASLILDSSVCMQYPSVLAAAAVRNALMLLEKNELLTNLERSPLYKMAEKKTESFSFVTALHRKALRKMSSPLCDHKSLLEIHDVCIRKSFF